MIIEITDSTEAMLSAIAHVSRDVAFEKMSKIGYHIKRNAGTSMRANRFRHNWHQKPVKSGKRAGKLQPYYDDTKTKELGLRTGMDGRELPVRSMENLIGSFLSEQSGTLTVGGSHKSAAMVKRREGLKVGTEKFKGVGHHSWSIINKLDSGERNSFHGWGKFGVERNSMKGFAQAKYRGRGFMYRGYVMTKPYMKSELTDAYDKTVGRAVNRVQVNLKPSKRAVS